jgi:hypothetical protein
VAVSPGMIDLVCELENRASPGTTMRPGSPTSCSGCCAGWPGGCEKEVDGRGLRVEGRKDSQGVSLLLVIRAVVRRVELIAAVGADSV